MESILLPHDAWILIGDGRKALVLRNAGDAKFPNLETSDVLKDAPNPATSDLGTDKPGRAFASTTSRRGAYEQTDWHEIAEQRFAHHVAEILAKREQAGAFKAIVVVAPPKTLAELRHTFPETVKRRIIAEIDKDLTKHPVHEIERLLSASA